MAVTKTQTHAFVHVGDEGPFECDVCGRPQRAHCTHEAWERNGSSRVCVDCGENLPRMTCTWHWEDGGKCNQIATQDWDDTELPFLCEEHYKRKQREKERWEAEKVQAAADAVLEVGTITGNKIVVEMPEMWPPPVMSKWLRNKTVKTDDLIEEMGSWLTWLRESQ